MLLFSCQCYYFPDNFTVKTLSLYLWFLIPSQVDIIIIYIMSDWMFNNEKARTEKETKLNLISSI